MTQRSEAGRRMPWELAAPQSEPDRLVQLADDILHNCRGEGPANCVARCPLNVDARGYVQLAAEGKFDEALQLVREQLPFPGILGYICAHPCELHCKKIDEDSAIRVRDVKRFLAEREEGDPRHILDREPQRSKTVAVVGGGPAGLIAAHDLARRGYGVTVLEAADRVGGCLVSKLPEWRLPAAVRDRDLSIIDALGIEVRTGCELGRDTSLEALRTEHDAVLLLLGHEGGQRFLERDGGEFGQTSRGTLSADPLTCETAMDGVFAGGEAVSGPGTVIHALALGRRAAESAHRWLNGEDLRVGRDEPLPARLLWQLDIDEGERQRRERAPVMLQPYNQAMTEAEVLAEGQRCLNCVCGLCVKDCEFLTKHCDSPKDLARRVKAGVLDELEMVYSCNVCELCHTVCPVDLDTGAMLLTARQQAVQAGQGPLKPHKPIISYFNAGVSNLFTLTMPEPGKQKSKRLFFTGCALPAVAPKATREVYDHLRTNYPGTGVLMHCCGAPVEVIGMEKEFSTTMDAVRRSMDEQGAEELLVACPDCYHTMHQGAPDLPLRFVWELLADSWQPPQKRAGEKVAIHDSCKARHSPAVHDAVRTLVGKGGAEVEDIDYARDMARCCGFGGMIYPVDDDLRQDISRRRADESQLPMITYCAGCRIALRSVGKDAVHILDFLLSENLEEACQAKPTGSIPRYVNRLRTKWAFKRLKPVDPV
jgi:glutamate synthase (NADPH/NADH) small chain